MMAYNWVIDGRSFANYKPIDVQSGQRVRLALRNKTAMWHPMHLEGHTFRVGGRLMGHVRTRSTSARSDGDDRF